MTNTRMEEITANARQAAMQARAGWKSTPVPGSYTTEEARIWQERYQRALKGGV